MAHGLMIEGSYVWSKSLITGPSADSSLYTRGTGWLDDAAQLRSGQQPTSFDIPQALKLNVIYELPFGPGRHFWPRPIR